MAGKSTGLLRAACMAIIAAAALPGGADEPGERSCGRDTGPASEPAPSADVVDTTTLPALLRERGFTPPSGGFLAYVEEITFDEDREQIVRRRRFDYGGTSAQVTGWNPASTVKLFAATAALLRMRELGFDPDATITYHGSGDDHAFTLRELVEAAIGPSDNLAYDYLTVFSGFDYLHGDFFVEAHGFGRTALRVAYAREQWTGMGFDDFFRTSPAMTVSQDDRVLERPEEHGATQVECSQAACTTLLELGETLRRIVFQEKLPPEESLGLHPDDLELLRGLLGSTRSRGEEAVKVLRPFFGSGARIYHKAGYASEWFTDDVLIDDPDLDRAWLIVLAGNPGRSALDDAARLVGEILSTGALDP
ncbi:MAG: serine hydrolase [Deltaproteobacteria bacterium]|nr:serine hydrolase [Deltaproteobacteria bacterium]